VQIKVVTESGREMVRAHEVRIPGWTEERYFDEGPEQGFYEYKDGELIVHSPVNIDHQRVVQFLDRLLGTYASSRGCGEVFAGPGVLRLRRDLDREPDLFFVSIAHAAQIKKKYVEAPADLVIEVTSAGSESRDLKEKREEYLAAGICEYLVVNPEARQITVHRLVGTSYQVTAIGRGRLESSPVPGFWIEVDWLWQRPLPNVIECLDLLLQRS